MVFEGEMRHSCKTLFTFTRPYFGTAGSRSKTFAEWTYSGGSSSRSWMLTLPAFRSRLSVARLVRISFARWSASMRWTRERSGAAVVGLAGVFVAGGMGGESTALGAADKVLRANISRGELDVHSSRGELMPSTAFAGLSSTSAVGSDDRPGPVARSSPRTRAPASGSLKDSV